MRTTAQKEISSNFTPPFGMLQRKCAGCGNHTVAGGGCADCEKEKGLLQRRATGSERANDVPPIVHQVVDSPGQPLDTDTRTFMEPRFNHDFSRVRVHSDERAAESAKAVNALAYTIGSRVVFGQGQYDPTTHRGRQLLAHELTHVVQQRGFAANQKLELGEPTNSYERQADEIARAVVQAPDPASNKGGAVNQVHSAQVSRLSKDFGGVLRRQHIDSTAVDPQDTVGTSKRVREAECPDKFRCKPPYTDRQVCCSQVSGVTGLHIAWHCMRTNPKYPGEFTGSNHATSGEARAECAKKG